MGALTEAEIFSCLADNFKSAAEHCENLAKLPKKGPTYNILRKELKLLEGACRQAAYWRQDARWLQIGLYMHEVHERAGAWLRGYKINGVRITHREGTIHPLFMKLAENLRAAQKSADKLRTAKTGRVGMILPKAASVAANKSHVQVLLPTERRSAGGVILPAGA